MVYQGRVRPLCNLFRGISWHTLHENLRDELGEEDFGKRLLLDFEGKDQRRGRRGGGTLKVGLWDF